MSFNVRESLEDLKKAFESNLEKLKREFDEHRKTALQPARQRLEEIREMRAKLDREEFEILEALGEERRGEGRKKRKSSGRRMTAVHKREVLSKFIRDHHIKNGTVLSKELRIALKDEGLGINDFRMLGNYLPSGWEARSNGLRGTAALTTFHHNG